MTLFADGTGDVFGAVLGLLFYGGLFLLYVLTAQKESDAEPDLHIAGRVFVSQEKAEQQAASRRAADDPGLDWGGVTLPLSADELFFLITGSIGSGKTKFLTALLRGLLGTVRPESDRRLLVFDPRNELYSVLFGMDPECPVVTLNPADLRSAAWDIGRDVTDPAGALEIAGILLPKSKGDANPFFDVMVRNLLAGVLLDLLLTAPGRYTLRDAVLILGSEGYLRQVIDRTPYNHHLRSAFEPAVTWKSIEATVAAKTAELRILAAYWHHARDAVSLADWVADQSSTLVLGTDPRIETTSVAVNRLLVKRLSELILAGPEGTPKRTYLAIDELPALGGDQPVPGLADLCHRGRARGARVAVVFQTVEDLRRIYTDHGAHALLAEFGNKLLLRAEDPAHAKWCSEVVGDTEDWEKEESWGPGGRTVRWVRYKRPLVPPAEFYQILPATPANGLNGYALSPFIDGVWKAQVPGAWVSAHLPRANPFVPAFVPRPAEHQYLPPFTEADLARLKLRRPPRIVGGKGAA